MDDQPIPNRTPDVELPPEVLELAERLDSEKEYDRNAALETLK